MMSASRHDNVICRRNLEEVKMIEQKSLSSVCKPIAHLGKFLFFATLLSLIQYEFGNYAGYYDLISNLLQRSLIYTSLMGELS